MKPIGDRVLVLGQMIRLQYISQVVPLSSVI
jgi:hypothetical protein